jgi:protease-4
MYEVERPSPSLFSRLLRGLDGLRRFLVNVLFFGLLAGLVIASFGGRTKVPDGAALVLKPRGVIVEQLSAVDPVERFVSRSSGAGAVASETLLKDLLDAIRLAKDDAKIKALYLDTNDMAGAGFTKLRDLRDALADFKKSGKKVIAYGDAFMQAPFYLAAQADELFLNPEGMVLITGFGGYRQYYKEGLDKFGIEMHVFRVGEYKSAVEPYLRNDMSKEAREMSLDTYGDLWREWLADVSAARKLSPGDISGLVEAMPDRLRAAGGDLAKLALDAKLVDTLAPRDEVRQRLITLVGEDKPNHTFKQIAHADYLKARGGDRTGATGRGKAVAVVVAKGTILDGTQPAGTVGGDSTARLLRRARENESVSAVVLRVDSPGGSAFASEIIRRECELVRKSGKPLVVSMGTVAASGGYWISTASDEIWAQPETITGSIGIFGVFPTFHKPLAKYLGVHADGAGTTRFVGALRPDLPLDPAVGDVVQQSINDGYRDFLERVAEARKLTPEQVDTIGRGRIWSGEDAKAHGLVDQLGTLSAAIESAAKRAKLEKDYRVWYIEKEKSFREQLLEMLTASAEAVTGFVAGPSDGVGSDEMPQATTSPLSLGTTLRRIEQDIAEAARWNDPRGVYAHCLCGYE